LASDFGNPLLRADATPGYYSYSRNTLLAAVNWAMTKGSHMNCVLVDLCNDNSLRALAMLALAALIKKFSDQVLSVQSVLANSVEGISRQVELQNKYMIHLQHRPNLKDYDSAVTSLNKMAAKMELLTPEFKQ
jgi:hypothetical protein